MDYFDNIMKNKQIMKYNLLYEEGDIERVTPEDENELISELTYQRKGWNYED